MPVFSGVLTVMAVTPSCRRLPVVALLAALAVPSAAAASEGDVIVRYRAGAGAAEREDARLSAGVRHGRDLGIARLELVKPKTGVGTGEAIAALERDDDVLFAEPDGKRYARVLPNDPRFGQQWGLENTGQTLPPPPALGAVTGTAGADIDAPAAWDVSTGSPSVLLAVIDTGVDLTNADLQPNLWANPRETQNAVDDDGNGLIDDTQGWDFVDDDRVPADLNDHGTHVSGIADARGNDGTGVAGVSWNATVVPLRVLDATGAGNISDAIAAYGYAAAAGVRVANLSFGGPAGSQAERDAIAAASNVLFVVAAGNSGTNNDALADFPCNYDVPNIVCVAASDQNDGLAGFSNFGRQTVDLAAPGVNVLSTIPGGFDFFSGTSMATPMVAGIAGIVRSQHAAYSAVEVKNAIMNGVDRPRGMVLYDAFANLTGLPRRALSGPFTVTRGRADAFGALRASTRNATPRSDGNIDGARRMRGAAVTGRVSWPADANDVYRRRLKGGARYRVELRGPPGADLDLWVWRPGTTEIAQFTRGCFVGRACPALAAQSGGEGSNERAEFTAREPGPYYVQVNGWYSGGRYRLRLDRI